MIIGIDASKASDPQKTGIANTVYPLILELQKINKDDDFILYSPTPLNPELYQNKNFKERLIPLPKLWHRLRLSTELLLRKPDIFLEPSNALPSFFPSKSLLIVHDLAFKYFPEAYSKFEQFQQESAIKNALHSEATVIVSSQANQDDLIKFYDFPKNRIEIIPFGFSNTKISTPNIKNRDKFILSVGRLEKRKNTARLVKSFYKYKEESKDDLKLILVGKPGFGYDEIIKKIDSNPKHKDDVIIKGYVEDNELVELYSCATALVYPSLYEGFGYPILEAMSYNTPVVTSSIPTLQEIAKDAVLYVNPENSHEITKAIKEIVNNKKLRDELIGSSKNILQNYSWTKTAHSFNKLFQKISK